MKNSFNLKRIALIAVLFFVLSIPNPSVFAAGIVLYEQGDPAVGTASVGQQVADDASTAFFNPAGMTALDRSEVLFGPQLLILNSEFETDSDVQNPLIGNDGGNAGVILPMGGVYYAQKFLKGRAAAGLAINAPAGFGLNYDNEWKGRYLSQKELLLVANINPSLGLKITDWLHVGGGLSVYYSYLELDMAIFNPPSVSLLPLQVNRNLDGNAELKADDWQVGYNLGLLLKPRKGTKVGFSYRSEANFKMRGHIKLDHLGGALTNTLDTKSDIEVDFTLPRQIMISLHQDINERLALLFDVGWQDWSSMKNLTISGSRSSVEINEDWTDTWRIGIGAHYRLLDDLKLKAGFSYDSSPTSLANRNVLIPVGKQWRWGAGLDYDINPNMVLSLNWEFIGMDSARLEGDIEPIVIDPPGRRTNPRTIFPGREMRGDYNEYINLIGISFRWKFGPGEADSLAPPSAEYV